MICNVAIVEYLGQVSQISAIHENRTRIDLRTGTHVRENEKISLWIPPDKILVFPKPGRFICMNDEKRWSRSLFLILLPGLVFIIFLFIYPFLYGLYLSLTDAEGAFTDELYKIFYGSMGIENGRNYSEDCTSCNRPECSACDSIRLLYEAWDQGRKAHHLLPDRSYYPWNSSHFRRNAVLYGTQWVAESAIDRNGNSSKTDSIYSQLSRCCYFACDSGISLCISDASGLYFRHQS